MIVIKIKKNKYLKQYIIFDFFDSNAFPKVLFALIPLNKNIE